MAVVPSQRQGDRETDDEQDDDDPAHEVGPLERVSNELLPMRERERGTEIAHAPLNDFVLDDVRPDRCDAGRLPAVPWTEIQIPHRTASIRGQGTMNGRSVAAGS